MKHLVALLVALSMASSSLGLESFRNAPRAVDLEKQRGSIRRMEEEVLPSPTMEPTHEAPTHEPTHGEPTHEPTIDPDGPSGGETFSPTMAGGGETSIPTTEGGESPTPDGGGTECTLLTPEESTEECKVPGGTQGLPLCAGIRGNGARLWAHFPALARTVEDFGPISAVAGGSSATVTSFLVESIISNPLVVTCGSGGDGSDVCCSGEEQRARISFLLKTVEQVPEETAVTPTELLLTIWVLIEEQDILPRLLSNDPEVQQGALEDLLAIFSLPEIAPIVNPELIELLQTSPDPIFHATDILNATSQPPLTVGDDVLVFIRPYILNFAFFADIVDITASFYAGLEPADLDKMNAMLNDCAMPSVGKDWDEIQDIETSSDMTCGEQFMSVYQTFLVLRNDESPTRLDDSLGDTVKALINIAVLRDDAVDIWKKASEDYFNAIVPVDFMPSFDQTDFGYYGDQDTLNFVTENIPVLFDDAKSNKFAALGPSTWRDVLQQSPAEPTLSRGVPIMDGKLVSVAGWNDPTPAQVLTSMGCDRVVLINRPGGQGNFGLEVAKLLGATDQELFDLYSLDNEESAFITALRDADASYCADWDSAPLLDVEAIANEGYIAPLLSQDPCILSLDVGAVDEDLRGCTP